MDVLQRNAVRVLGSGGPVLLYANGFGCHQGMWSRLTPSFESTHRQVLFDYCGAGHASREAFDPRRHDRLDGYAQDLLEVCDALGLGQGVTLVAHSVSCSIGMLAQIARPALFERLVMLGPSPCFIDHPPDYVGGFQRQDLEELLALMDQNYIGWAGQLAPLVAGASGAGAPQSELHDSFCSTDPQTARVFARATFFADNRAEVPRVGCPVLILQHARDALAPPEVGRWLQRHLPAGTLRTLDVSGHCAHLSDPRQVAQAMSEWLPSRPAD